MIAYSELREIQKKELEGGALVELDADFYSQVLELLNERKEEAKKGSMIVIREYENLKRILSTIIAKREEKIVLMALRSEKSHIGLTTEEKDVYLKVQQIISEHREKCYLCEESKESSIKKLKIVKDMEKYKGTDEKIYGPFKTGEEHFLPNPEAEWLLKEKIAELIV